MKSAISVYGPKGLVEKLEKYEWTPCDSEGENFKGIALFGYCLYRPIDKMGIPMSFIVREAEDIFNVSGYGFPVIFVLAANWQLEHKIAGETESLVELADCQMSVAPDKDLVSYDILILDEAALAEYENMISAGKLLH